MKKQISLFLLLVMLAAMVFPPVSAARGPEVSPQACSHDYRLVDEIVVQRYHNNETHRNVRVRTYVCEICGAADQTEVGIGQYQIGRAHV